MEREHEREEFQQEIKNLEVQLRLPSKGHTGGNTKGQRVSNTCLLAKRSGCHAVGERCCFYHISI